MTEQELFKKKYNLRKSWNQSCLAMDIPALSFETCAKICAVINLYGNDEQFTYNPKFVADTEYIQERFGIYGGETPDADFVEEVKYWTKVCEDYTNNNTAETTAIFADAKPQWAIDLFQEQYNIKL